MEERQENSDKDNGIAATDDYVVVDNGNQEEKAAEPHKLQNHS